MDGFPVKLLKLINEPEGIYEHESGVRINRRRLPEVTDLHWHDYFELELVLSGRGIHQFNGMEYPLERGCAFMLTPVDFHKVLPTEDLELCTLMFPDHIVDSSLLARLWSLSKKQRLLTIPADDQVRICRLFDLLFEEFAHKENYRKDFIHNIVECIFIIFLRRAEMDAPIAHPFFNTPIQDALSYIHSHFRQNPSLSEAAAICRYSSNYFCEIFKKNTGMTYNKYLNDLKLSFARQLLTLSDLSVTEICFASGFSSLSHFLRTFKSTFGVSPQSMRGGEE